MLVYSQLCKFVYPDNQVPLPSGGKRSIFARQIAARNAKEGKTTLLCAPEAAPIPEISMDIDQSAAADDRE